MPTKTPIEDSMFQHRIDVAGLEVATVHQQIVNFEKWMVRALLTIQADTLEEVIPLMPPGPDKDEVRKLMRGTRAEIAKLGGSNDAARKGGSDGM